MLTVFSFLALSGQTTDSITIEMNEVSVVANRLQTGLKVKNDGRIVVNPAAAAGRVQSFGEADIAKSLLSLPEFSTASDISSGLSVNGEEMSQTSYLLNGAPVFFPFHFGGIFSVFNLDHIGSVSVSPWLQEIGELNRVGHQIEFETPKSVEKPVSGTVSLGLISSRATLHLNPDTMTLISVSARASYINQLYSGLLDSELQKVNYRFQDYNLSVLRRIDSHNSFDANLVTNFDYLNLYDRGYEMATVCKWNNTTASLRWYNTTDKHDINISAYYAGFRDRLNFTPASFDIEIPSKIHQEAVRGMVNLYGLHLKLGFDGELTQYVPLSVNTTGNLLVSNQTYHLSSRLLRMYGQWSKRIFNFMDIEIGLRATGYASGDYSAFLIDPSVTFIHSRGNHTLTCQIMSTSQFQHSIDISDVGLACNFWLPSSRQIKPQRAFSLTAHYGQYFGNALSVRAGAFYKRIVHDAQFKGNILDFLSPFYRYSDNVESVDGFNAGASVSGTYNLRFLSVSANYAFTLSRRKYDGYDGYLPSNHEILNTLKAQITASLNKHWEVCANFVYHTGRPYTPVKAFYVMAGNILSVKGLRNCRRLPSYHRLDLSATYSFSFKIAGKCYQNLLNMSVCNVYGKRNVESQYYAINYDNFYLKRHYSIVRFLPSVSYTIKF